MRVVVTGMCSPAPTGCLFQGKVQFVGLVECVVFEWVELDAAREHGIILIRM